MNFQVELTSYCDLTCGYCPNKDMERQRSFMSDEVWNKILHDYIVPYRHVNAFCTPTFIGHKDGEPLLNKMLPSRLRDLSAVCPEINIDIYSHGLMLPKLAAQGRDFIRFLASLPNKVRYLMSYHPRNHDGSVNDYGSVELYLKEVLSERKPTNVEFITVSHRSKWVTEEMQEAWRYWWRDLPITVHCNVHLNPWTGRIEDTQVRFNGCPYADFGHWFFGATGNVIACCLDLEEEIVLGNVMKDDPETMFRRTDQFYALQRVTRTTQSKVPHQVCANCFGQEREDKRELLELGVPTK